VRAREDQALIEIVNGSVTIQAARRRGTYKPRDVRVTPSGRIVEVSNPGTLKKKTGQHADILTQWKFYFGDRSSSLLSNTPQLIAVSHQAAQDSEVAANRVVHFEVDPPSLGTLQQQDVITDASGVARVKFKAGGTEGIGEIRGYIVKVPNLDHPETTSEVYHRNVRIERLSFFRLRNTLIFAAIGGAVIGCVIKCGNKEPGPPRVIIIP
jgi:hypothetical protein